MTWEKFLPGFLTMLTKMEAAIVWWKSSEVALWQTFLIVTCWTSITLIMTFLGISCIKMGVSWIKKRNFLRKISEKFWNWYRKTKFHTENHKQQKKITNWVGRQENRTIIALGFVPVPWLPTIVIATTKLLEIKFGLTLLLLGNAFRVGAICCFYYWISELVSRIFSS